MLWVPGYHSSQQKSEARASWFRQRGIGICIRVSTILICLRCLWQSSLWPSLHHLHHGALRIVSIGCCRTRAWQYYHLFPMAELFLISKEEGSTETAKRRAFARNSCLQCYQIEQQRSQSNASMHWRGNKPAETWDLCLVLVWIYNRHRSSVEPLCGSTTL